MTLTIIIIAAFFSWIVFQIQGRIGEQQRLDRERWWEDNKDIYPNLYARRKSQPKRP